MYVHDCTLHIHKSCPATCEQTYLSRVTKSTSPFKYVVPEKNMFIINEYWRMYYVLGLLCTYSSTSFVEKQKSQTDMPNSNEFDEYLWGMVFCYQNCSDPTVRKKCSKTKLFQEAMFFVIIFTCNLNWPGVLSRLFTCI